MGNVFGTSKLEKLLGDQFPVGEHYFGFENYGNTCYCNSVLQALYFCLPFREQIINHHTRQLLEKMEKEESLLSCLSELFSAIHSAKRKTGSFGPRKFVSTLKEANETFQGFTQQDAHEFLNYLLNEIAELLEKEQKKFQKNSNSNSSNNISEKKDISSSGGNTFVHTIFEGILTNETKCLTCQSVSSRDESFLDLSIDIEQNTSLTHCLKHFSSTEKLTGQNLFFCEKCNDKTEAEKRIKIKKLPMTLVLHLKRFKYIEEMNKYKKLGYRVVFPLEMRLGNTTNESQEPERLYTLFAIVIHMGSGPNLGHYISLIKSYGNWILFDDENIELIEEQDIRLSFGSTNEMLNRVSRTDCGYLLFYQQSDVLKVCEDTTILRNNQTNN